jgi:hypothetical protein
VLSSTSSSDERLPSLPWLGLIGLPALLFALLVAALELDLARIGVEPTTPDSEALWLSQRDLADRYGSSALVLTGASRFHLGIDLAALRAGTGLKPVQLAIDGTTSLATLNGLADDPDFHGVVLVDYYAHVLSGPVDDTATLYERRYEFRQRHGFEGLELEEWLTDQVRGRLRIYADDSSPFNTLVHRVLVRHPPAQYIALYPDRSRAADYTQVRMPDFYYARAIRNLEIAGNGSELPKGTSPEDARREIERRISIIAPADNQGFLAQVQNLKRLAAQIRGRGGAVVIVRMPSSGYVLEEEERRFPRQQFWDRLVAESGLPAINFADEPSLKDYRCPDGSHLDKTDRASFTEALARVLRRVLSAGDGPR